MIHQLEFNITQIVAKLDIANLPKNASALLHLMLVHGIYTKIDTQNIQKVYEVYEKTKQNCAAGSIIFNIIILM